MEVMNNKELIRRLISFDDDESVNTSTGHVSVTSDSGDISSALNRMLDEYATNGTVELSDQSRYKHKPVQEYPDFIKADGNNIICDENLYSMTFFDVKPLVSLLKQRPDTHILLFSEEVAWVTEISFCGSASDLSLIFSRLECWEKSSAWYDPRTLTLIVKDDNDLILQNDLGPMWRTSIIPFKNQNLNIIINADIYEFGIYPNVDYTPGHNENIKISNLSCDSLKISRNHFITDYGKTFHTQYLTNCSGKINDWQYTKKYDANGTDKLFKQVPRTNIYLNNCNIEDLELIMLSDVTRLYGLSGVQNLTLGKESTSNTRKSPVNHSRISAVANRFKNYNIINPCEVKL